MQNKIICTVTNDLTYDQRMIRICTTLAEQGYDVLLLGRSKKHSQPFVRQAFRQKRLSCFFQSGKFFYIEYNIRLLVFLLSVPFDAICAVDLDTLLPAYLCSRWRKKICVYDAHEYFTEVPEINRRVIIKKVWEVLASFLIPRIKYAYTVGFCLSEVMEERYNTPFSVIRNMPFRSKKQYKISKSRQPKVLLYQGALNEGRGLEALIHTMQNISNAELWLAGEGDLSQGLRTTVKEQGLEDKVKFLGYLSPLKLQELTPQAYLGFNLLENKGLSYYYSLANKAFDYIQAGVPSLNMSFPEYEKLNADYHTFWLIPDLSVPQIEGAINRLMEDEELYQRLQQNCLVTASVLNWEAEQEKLIRFYKNVFSEPVV